MARHRLPLTRSQLRQRLDSRRHSLHPAPRPASPSSRRSLLLKASNKYPQSTLTATGDNYICFTDELENVERWDLPREPGPAAGACAACQAPGPARGEDSANPWPSRHLGWTPLPTVTLRWPRAAPRLLRVTPGARQAGSSPLAWQHSRWDGHPALPPPIPCPLGLLRPEQDLTLQSGTAARVASAHRGREALNESGERAPTAPDHALCPTRRACSHERTAPRLRPV